MSEIFLPKVGEQGLVALKHVQREGNKEQSMVYSDIPDFLREVKIQMQALNSWTLPDPKYKKCRIQCSVEPGIKIYLFFVPRAP